ncbi:fimbrial protein [Pseudomonas nicosulfuronedens]
MKANLKFIATIFLSGAALASQHLFAADGTITFNGQVTAATCDISTSGGGKDFTVTLPTVSTSSLSSANSTAGRTPFSINLSNCSPASGTVHAFFESGLTTGASGNLALDSGGAPNVEIQLLNTDLSVIKAGYADASQNSRSVPITPSGTADLNYNAQYVSVQGSAGAGPANSSVEYTIAYQ